MTTIARLKVLMEADSHQLTSALSKIKKQVFNVRSAFAVLAGAGGVGALVTSQLRAADEMEKFSRRIGISVGALSELRHAAKLSGVGVNQLQNSLQKMVRRIGEVASTGKGEAKSALERLGLDAKKLATLKPADQLNTIADALLKVEAQTEKVFLAQKIFDSEGVNMLQMMESGGAGIDKMRGKLRALGGTLTSDGAASAAEALDAIENLKASVAALGQAFATGLGGEVASFFNGLTVFLKHAIASFKTLGTTIGASAATMGAIFSGDFSGAAAIMRDFNVSDVYRDNLGGGSGETEKNTAETVDKLDELVNIMGDIGVAG